MKGYDMNLKVFFLILLLPFPVLAQEPLIRVQYRAGDISTDPADSIWASASAVSVELEKQEFVTPAGGSERVVSIKAINNGLHIAFLLEWEDKNKDTTITQELFSDKIAIQFPLKNQDDTPAFMGDEELPVNIWLWRSDKAAVAHSRKVYGDYRHPGDSAFIKDVSRNTGLIEDLNGFGPGTITSQASQDVTGGGIYNNNLWRVVMLRPMVTADPGDVRFSQGTKNRLAIAVWDGAEKERGSRKSVSGWIDIKIDKPD